MKTIQEILENSLFRIPDYQRGFSWKTDTHLDDFWQDLKNLREDRFHYTGTLTLEKPSRDRLKKWKGDDWIISSGNYKPYYVVDGQQRITTIVILINILIELMEDDEQYLYQIKEDLLAKYVYKRNEKKKLQSFIFGYEIDDPSYEYLKTKIFKQESSDSANQPETIYTNNLMQADKFFRNKIENWNFNEREILFKKVTQKLKFDLKIIDDDLDIFVVFETMNNRGKPLTNLEKLKNRLIYLSTLMQDSNETEKNQLRKEVNDVWKTCYEYLGKNKKNPLSDDTFLRTHFIVYHYFEKTKDFPNHQIFKEIYTVQKTVAKIPGNDFNTIRKFINSLQKSAKLWYIINNPKQALTNELINDGEAYWLEKLMRLGLGSFAPLTLCVYLICNDDEIKIDYLKAVESFIFLNYHCSGRKSSLGNSHFPYLASQLYYQINELTIAGVIETIKYWTYGNSEEEGYFSSERFIAIIKDQFSHSKKNGYYDWSGLKYLLFEYEEHLQGDETPKVKWKTLNSIEHVYPQNDADISWKAIFKDFSPKQKKILCNSLGNFALLRNSKNSQLSNKSFAFKKQHEDEDGNAEGYCIGSHSELQIYRTKEWDAKAIFKRGISILKFLQIRWEVNFSQQEKNSLLLADDQLIEKMK